MTYSAGLCSRAGCLGRSVDRTIMWIKILLLAVLAVGLIFAGEALFGRADVRALIAAVILCAGCIIYWDRRVKEILLWIRATIWGSVWRAARYF